MSAFAVVDFDNDGHPDLLALAVGRILWFKNDGAGQFAAAGLLKTQVPSQVNKISTADLDNDGDLDVLVGNARLFSHHEPGLFWVRNEGGWLGAIEEITLADSGPFRTTDFDGDGDLDVVQGGLAVSLYENTGPIDGRRFRFARILAPGPAGSLVFGDFDDDGDQDLVATHQSFDRFNEFAFYYEQREPGQLVLDPYAKLAYWTDPERYDHDMNVSAADLDGDDVPDLIINGFIRSDTPDYDGFLFLYHSLVPPRKGEFIAVSPEPTSRASWGSMSRAVADVDGDGDGDVVGSRSTSESDSLFWYENPGKEDDMQVGWKAHRIAAVRFARSLAAVDVNNDGAIDLVTLGDSDNTFRDHLFWYENLGGDGSPTAVDTTEPLPRTFEVRSVWPNPSSGSVTIAYQLAQPTQVRLQVFDVLGRSVATLVEAVQVPGVHEASFEVQDLPSGTYFYRLEAGGQVLTGPLSRVR